MPKELQVSTIHRASPYEEPKSQQRASPQAPSGPKSAMWKDADDRLLVSARASGLNWQPIASRHFPNKTANACRKRHERLMERGQHDDWEPSKLDQLARAYMECRQEIWSILSAKLDERWVLVEAKCMEKGLKNLQVRARAAAKRDKDDHQTAACNEEASSEGEGDEELSNEDVPKATGSRKPSLPCLPSESSLRAGETEILRLQRRSLPPLPLYQPPESVISRSTRVHEDNDRGGGIDSKPGKQVQGAVTIRSMLLDTEE